jgi:hypothetical protein
MHSLKDQSTHDEVLPQWGSEMHGVLQAPVQRENSNIAPASGADPDRTDTDPELTEIGQSRRKAAVQGEMNRRHSARRAKRRRKELTGPADDVDAMEDWELDERRVGGAAAEDDGSSDILSFYSSSYGPGFTPLLLTADVR